MEKHRLTRTNLKQDQFANTVHVATPDGGVPYDRVLEPSFWALVSNDFKEMDEIKVIPQDYSYFAHLLVVKVSKMDVYVKEISHKSFESHESQSGIDVGDYEIKWAGRHAKFRVFRKADGAMLQEHINTREEAIKWIAEYERALAA